MLRRLLIPALALTALFALALALVHAQPPDPRLDADFGGCAACWQGVQAGVTLRPQASALLSAAMGVPPIQPPCFSLSDAACGTLLWISPRDSANRTQIQFDQDTAQTIFNQSPGFTVGDALVTLDRLHQQLYDVAAGFQRSTLFLQVTFARASLTLSATVLCPADYTALLWTPVDLVVVQPPASSGSLAPTSLAFLRRAFARLCQN